MVKIQTQVSLKKYNTFNIDVTAKYFTKVKSISDLKQVLVSKKFKEAKKHLILGGGSNVLFVNDYNGFVIKNEIKGIKVVKKTKNYTFVKFGAGENWDNCVKWAVNNGLGGIENLSLIPGSMGAAPVQNIGAYGVELKDTFFKLKAVNIKTGKVKEYSKKACKFGYRLSIFKKQLKNKVVITSVTLKLSNNPIFNTQYKGIVETIGGEKVSLKSIRNAVIKIRKSKLPDPNTYPNCGSFFKNPIVSNKKYNSLLKKYPDIVGFANQNKVKLSAGWLIDKCGLKGYKYKDAGVYKNHALVIVNLNKATGKQVYKLKEIIKKEVYKKFGVKLQEEVNLII